MAKFYSNENFDKSVIIRLREIGHDVLTTLEAGKANQGIPDEAVLMFAISEKRIVLTFNRKDFIKLHRAFPDHFGIMICTRNPDAIDLASKIDTEIKNCHFLTDQKLMRVYRGM